MPVRARHCRATPDILLMDRELFDQYASHSDVPEPVKAQQAIPDDLLNEESIFIAT